MCTYMHIEQSLVPLCNHHCALATDSKLLITGCDDMHANLYDANQGALVDSFSGMLLAYGGLPRVQSFLTAMDCFRFSWTNGLIWVLHMQQLVEGAVGSCLLQTSLHTRR